MANALDRALDDTSPKKMIREVIAVDFGIMIGIVLMVDTYISLSLARVSTMSEMTFW